MKKPSTNGHSQREVRSVSVDNMDALTALKPFGGFKLLSGAFKGIQNMDPEKRARRNAFLTETGMKKGRAELLQKLKTIRAIVSEGGQLPELTDKVRERYEMVKDLKRSNVRIALENGRTLEVNYRMAKFFFDNAIENNKKLTKVSFVNASKDQLGDANNPTFVDAIFTEINNNYDQLDLSNNYSLLGIPGFISDKRVVDKITQKCLENKVVAFMDYREYLGSAADVLEMFPADQLTSSNRHSSQGVMTCNSTVARTGYPEYEEATLYQPVSVGLLGRVYAMKISQIVAGKKYGKLRGVNDLKFDLLKSKIGELGALGLNPAVTYKGDVMPYTGNTLYRGGIKGYETYSIVRVFDWVTKVLIDYANGMVGGPIDGGTLSDIKNSIEAFFRELETNGIIHDYNEVSVLPDAQDPTKIIVRATIYPVFHVRAIEFNMSGQNGRSGKREWQAGYDIQQDE